MCKQPDTSGPRKHHADYKDRGNWGTTKNRNINIEVYSFKSGFGLDYQHVIRSQPISELKTDLNPRSLG